MTNPQFEGDSYRRMPTEIAEKVSSGIAELHRQGSGGRIRFSTDSDYIGIHATLNNPWRISNMANVIGKKSKGSFRELKK